MKKIFDNFYLGYFKKKGDKFYFNYNLTFIMCIITFIVGVIFEIIFCHSLPFFAIIKITFLSFIPFIIFVSIFLLKIYIQKKNVQIFLKVFNCIFSMLIIIYYFGSFWICVSIVFSSPFTNSKDYKRFIKDLDVLEVFPKEIPSHAKNVDFYYSPYAFLDGEMCNLYYIDDELDLSKFNSLYLDKAIWVGHKEEYVYDGLLNEVFYDTPVDLKKTDDFIIYLIDGKCDDSECDKGNYLLVAFNENTKEILYGFSKWSDK